MAVPDPERPRHRRRPLLTRRQIRIAVGLLWLLDAALQAQPHLFGAEWWHDDLSQSVMGQPAPVARSILWAVGLIAAHAAAWNGCFAVAQGVLGVCLLTGRFERTAIVASIPWALGVWWVGEGFGAIPTGFGLFAAGAPGPVLFYPLLSILAWPRPTSEDSPSRNTTSEPRVALRPGTRVWALLWVGGAILLIPWKFGPGRVLQANLNEFYLGPPTGLGGIVQDAYRFAGAHPVEPALMLALVQTAIGLGALCRRTRRIALTAGIVLSVAFWVVVQAFGGMFSGNATDPGTGPLIILLGLAVWPAAPFPRAIKPTTSVLRVNA